MSKHFNNALKAVSGFIQFANRSDKEWAVEHFDSNNDGELGKSEAAVYKISDYRDFLYDKNGIQLTGISNNVKDASFLQYFTGLTYLNERGIFRQQNSSNKNFIIEKVVFPPTCTVYGGNVGRDFFQDTPSLKYIEFTCQKEFTVTGLASGQTDLVVVLPKEDTWWKVAWNNGATFLGTTNCKVRIQETGKEFCITEIPQDVTSLRVGALSYNLTTNETLNISRFASLPQYMCFSNKIIKFVNFSEQLKYIPQSAFQDCSRLALTELPSGVTSIGQQAFQNCTSLALTELPSGVTSIGQQAFQDCSRLALTELPSGVTSIGQQAFRNCTSLALTELPSGVTSINAQAFQNCTSLALTELPSGVTSINAQAFQNCTSLALTELPSGVTSINAQAFQNCNKMPYLILPENIKSIIAYQSFPYIDIMVRATTPPNLSQYYSYGLILGGKAYYVPDDSVSLYKEKWSIVANAIKPMSEWSH